MNRIISIFSLCLVLTFLSFIGEFNIKNYYSILNKGNLTEIEELISEIGKWKESNRKKAYIGALSIKKAQLLKSPKEKISSTKIGVKQLEEAILEEQNNIEFRFLRLIIQENAPKIIRYSKNLEEDKNLILKEYKNQNSTLKYLISDYSKTSKILNIK